jgi:hypothetical protein|uniref:Uncharacterized protein n=1 Tax=Bionectria ochroleuca TaxID=29856 RepID=A0A8H7TQI2_BIOOC
MAFERHSSQKLINTTARYDGQRAASSSRYRGSRAASRRSGHLNPKPSVEKHSRMAYYSQLLLSRIQQVASEVDQNRERYQTSSMAVRRCNLGDFHSSNIYLIRAQPFLRTLQTNIRTIHILISVRSAFRAQLYQPEVADLTGVKNRPPQGSNLLEGSAKKKSVPA